MSHAWNRALIARSAAAAALILSISLPALAGDVFYDVTLGLNVGDDSRFFLNLTNDRYPAPQQVSVAVVKRCPRPADDFPVVMLLASESRRSPDAVLAMRLRGMSWTDVLLQLNLSPDVLFVGMDRDPGPPYGNAWGYWKRHGGRPDKRRFALSDAQVVDLAKLQITSSYYRVSPYAIVGQRQRGVSVERYAVSKGRPSGQAPAKKGGAASKGSGSKQGQGQKQGKGQGHGQGHHPEKH
jgi:hypothetical protein